MSDKTCNRFLLAAVQKQPTHFTGRQKSPQAEKWGFVANKTNILGKIINVKMLDHKKYIEYENKLNSTQKHKILYGISDYIYKLPFFSCNVDSDTFRSCDIYLNDVSKIFHYKFERHAANGDVPKEKEKQIKSLNTK